ncbi:hypothetical protein D8911_08010 [Levilactobacillus brevis]|nr:hypothetical protein D8911_08010 [Levilactobacillus brevis]
MLVQAVPLLGLFLLAALPLRESLGCGSNFLAASGISQTTLETGGTTMIQIEENPAAQTGPVFLWLTQPLFFTVLVVNVHHQLTVTDELVAVVVYNR